MKDNKQYGLPKLKKYPMPDKRHVKSAIRFFNYVSPAQEKELARAIIKKMKKYGLKFTDFTVGDENRFRKYVPEKYFTHAEGKHMYSNNDFRYYKGGNYLAHYGVPGMKWGIRRYQPYGQGGYNRKGGATGKVVEEAKTKRSSFSDRLKQNNKRRELYREIREEVITSHGRMTDNQSKIKKLGYVQSAYKSLHDTHDKYKESLKPYREFNALSAEKKWAYADKAADRDWRERYQNSPENSISDANRKEEVRELMRMEYREVDPGYAFREYCRDKKLNYQKVKARCKEARDEYDNARKETVKDLLGKYGDKPVTKYKYKNRPTDRFYTKDSQSASLVLHVTLMEMADDDLRGYYLEAMPKMPR